MQQAPGTTAVGICDSHEITLAGLEWSLRDRGINVFATANREETAVLLAGAARNAVVLIDLALDPAPRGAMTAIEAISAAGGVPVAMGVDASPRRALDALRAGAMGYLTKDMPVAAVIEAIEAAARGEAALSREMTTQLVSAFRITSTSDSLAAFAPCDHRLTQREWEVLERVAAGCTNRHVASELCISVETVRTHVSHILAKLETPNRSAAAARFRQLQLARA
jgi:DNA-binding NarL/FixJ family response regulator